MSKGSLGVMPLPWQPGGLQHPGRRQTAGSGPTCSLHYDGIIHEHLWYFRINVIVQTLHPMNTHYQISLGMKI